MDGARDLTCVCLVLRPCECEEAAGCRREASQLGVHAHEGLVVPGTVLGTITARDLADLQRVVVLAPDLVERIDPFLLVLGRRPPGVVGRPLEPQGAIKEDGDRLLRVGRGEQRRQRRRFSPAVDGGTIHSGRCEDGIDVVQTVFERGNISDAVGHAGAAAV